MRLRVVGGALLILVSLAVAPGIASAACGVAPTLITAIEEADTVFVGRTVEVTDRGRTAEMEVLQVWKGRDLGQFVTVSGSAAAATGASSEDRIFETGRTYLVFPRNRTAPFTDDRCTATRFFEPAAGTTIPANLKAAVGADQARVPTAAVDGGTIDGARMMPWIVGMGLLLIGLLALWGYGRLTRGNPERASARRQQRIATEKAAAEAAVANRDGRPKPITHAASPFRKGGLSRIPIVRGIAGRFRRSGLRSARKMTDEMQKKYK